MNRKVILSIFLLAILTTFSSNVSGLDTTAVGVANGDTWTIEVTETSGVFADEDLEFGDLGIDLGGISSASFKITDATVDSDNTVGVDMDFNNTVTSTRLRLDLFGGPIVFTDWDFWKSNITSTALDFADLGDAELKIEDGNNAFVIKFSIEDDTEGTTSAASGVLSYQKDTGMFNEFRMSVKVTNQGFSATGGITIRNTNYLENDSSEDGIPGLLLTPALFAAILTSVVVLKKRRI